MSVSAVEIAEQRFFIKVDSPSDGQEPGVFLQDGRIVGWSFAAPEKAGYLWKGPSGDRLLPDVTLYDVYRTTFAESREERFLVALANDDAAERLFALAAGFGFEAVLPESLTPPQLRAAAVISEMRTLVADLNRQGFTGDVVNAVDRRAIVQMQSPALLVDFARAVEQYEGEVEALRLVEDVRAGWAAADPKPSTDLDRYHALLYRRWLQRLLQTGKSADAWPVFESARGVFPEDRAIHLLGVRTALAANDWATAEDLLYGMDYPPELGDAVNLLQSKISDLKGREGKIVIRFAPGARTIPVRARLNETMLQEFIIDTGASSTTIPRSTAEQLGYTLDERHPRRKVVTAGGEREAYEVILPSLDLGGQTANNVRVLVLDLPNQAGLGLLGMNLLNRFRMSLNADEGILVLTPR